MHYQLGTGGCNQHTDSIKINRPDHNIREHTYVLTEFLTASMSKFPSNLVKFTLLERFYSIDVKNIDI